MVFWFVGFLFCWIRAEGFSWGVHGTLGLFLSFLGRRVSLFPSFCGTFGFSLFFSRSGGSGVLSHGAGFGLGFHG